MTRRLLAAVALLGATAAPAAAVVSAEPCPPGDRGVIVYAAGRSAVVCTNAI